MAMVRIAALVAGLMASTGLPAASAGLINQSLHIEATIEGRRATLEAVMIRPDGPGPFPLAVLSHGSPRDGKERAAMSPLALLPQATVFARRGWAAVSVMRRGYGGSSGPAVEGTGPCNNPDYLASGRRSAADLRAVIGQLSANPLIDASRIISVGISAGGFASVALTAAPPPGLLAAISFAGGRGSVRPDEVCQEDRLVEAFRRFGQSSRLPTLWIYAENDHFFGPGLARRFHAAFTGAGGRAEFIGAPASGDDGHHLFRRGIDAWTPWVDRFLDDLGLAPRQPLIPVTAAHLAPPSGLSANGRAAFADYLAAAPNKAFALSSDRAFGWKSGQRSEADAQTGALTACRKHTALACRVFSVNDHRAE